MKRSAFISAFLLSAASLASAAVGDSVDTSLYVADGVIMSTQVDGSLVVNRADSTRFYDSTKGNEWVKKTASDSLFCWSHAASNSIQYWQSYYGVFAKPQSGSYYTDDGSLRYNQASMPLPYGRIGTESTKTIEADGTYSDTSVQIPDPNRLDVARDMYYSITNNLNSGTFKAAAEWFFTSQSDLHSGSDSFYFNSPSGPNGYVNCGGYYKNYFGNPLSEDAYNEENITKQSLSYTTVYSEFIEGLSDTNNSTNGAPFINNDIGAVKDILLAGFGITDGKQTQAGNIPVIGVWNENNSGHFITCYGFTLDENGNLESILIADSDDAQGADAISNINQYYIASTGNAEDGKILLYEDKGLSKRWGTYYIGEVSYINTPEVLKNMLAEYSDTTSEAQVWNGAGSEWGKQTATTEALPTEATGWDINVNGSNIAAEHQGYYHTYATEGRAVLFDDHAAEGKRTVTICGEVAASLITVAAEGYVFQKAESGGSIAVGADLALVNGATLDSRVALNVRDLTLEGNTTIKSGAAIVVTGDFLAALAPQAATFAAVRSTVTPQATVNASLDLRQADSVTLETSVNMNGNNLYIADAFKLVLNMVEDEVIPCFTNIGELYVGDAQQDSFSRNIQVYLNGAETPTEDYLLVYDSALSTLSLMLSIPEPGTATLGLLALATMAARRRRS